MCFVLPTCVLCCFVGSLISAPDGCLLTDEHSPGGPADGASSHLISAPAFFLRFGLISHSLSAVFGGEEVPVRRGGERQHATWRLIACPASLSTRRQNCLCCQNGGFSIVGAHQEATEQRANNAPTHKRFLEVPWKNGPDTWWDSAVACHFYLRNSETFWLKQLLPRPLFSEVTVQTMKDHCSPSSQK